MNPFDVLAMNYEELWSATAEGQTQRRQVWGKIDRLFAAGDHILDLGCGIGDDAVYLESKGIHVTGIDNSSEMVRVARSRGVNARRLAIQDLNYLAGDYEGALSNFGALNCVEDLHAVGEQLHRLIRPRGTVALCLMSRVFWRETVRFAVQFRFSAAIRRWGGYTSWRGIRVWYPTNAEIQRAFAPWFVQARRARIGAGDHVLHILRHAS